MPTLHRVLGNPVLSFIGRRLFASDIGDFHCGMRGFRRQAILDLDLRTTGMEFASEMVVRASLDDLDVREVPTTLRPDGRTREPHLRTWRDGWRHLRFLLLFSPRWLLLCPGIVLFTIGLHRARRAAAGPGADRIGRTRHPRAAVRPPGRRRRRQRDRPRLFRTGLRGRARACCARATGSRGG